MRIRQQTTSGDMVFGGGQQSFFQNVPDGVAQLVETRLKLWLGEWFLDVSDGTPWRTQVLGRNTTSTYDAAIQARILATPGVSGILSYSSTLSGRTLNVIATIDTIYGTATLSTSD